MEILKIIGGFILTFLLIVNIGFIVNNSIELYKLKEEQKQFEYKGLTCKENGMIYNIIDDNCILVINDSLVGRYKLSIDHHGIWYIES